MSHPQIMEVSTTGFIRRTRGKEVIPALMVGDHFLPTNLVFDIDQNATQYGTECRITVCNKDGYRIPGVHCLDVWISDNADGTGVVGTGPATSVAAKASSGVVMGSLTASKAFRVQTLATGEFTLQIIDDSTPVLLYVCASIPGIGVALVSRKTVAGDYKP